MLYQITGKSSEQETVVLSGSLHCIERGREVERVREKRE